MIKHSMVLFFLLNAILASAQTKLNPEKEISGEVVGKPIIDDTIYFKAADINSKYYEKPLLSSKLTANKFTIPNDVSYPQMYRVVFLSDKNIRAWRDGDYFIDPVSTTITTNYSSGECSEIDGITAMEYQTKFIPFITKGMVYDCKSNYLSGFVYDGDKKVDSLLFTYVVNNADSYVALWELIGRFSFQGQSAVRKRTLESFSNQMKNGKLWKILNEDFKNAKIKENEKFPDINLKNYDLAPTKFILPKAKYTLIDYWFCRCRPCLDTIPALKQLYVNYKNKGFEIASISVDETINVPLWQKRVKEHGLVWPQYLEENNFRENELGIKAFPTFILLDSQGRVIWKDFDLHDLDKFLKKNL
jgi:thiol-disulfide isomerase/thioredoxin